MLKSVAQNLTIFTIVINSCRQIAGLSQLLGFYKVRDETRLHT